MSNLGATNWWTYVQRHLDRREWTAADLARASGVSATRFTRWRNGEQPTADSVRAIAGALRQSVLEAFVVAGLLTAKEAQLKSADVDISMLSDTELVAEVGRRLVARRQADSPTVIRAKRPTPLTTLDGPGRKVVEEAANQTRAADDPDEPLMCDLQEQSWGDDPA